MVVSGGLWSRRGLTTWVSGNTQRQITPSGTRGLWVGQPTRTVPSTKTMIGQWRAISYPTHHPSEFHLPTRTMEMVCFFVSHSVCLSLFWAVCLELVAFNRIPNALIPKWTHQSVCLSVFPSLSVCLPWIIHAYIMTVVLVFSSVTTSSHEERNEESRESYCSCCTGSRTG